MDKLKGASVGCIIECEGGYVVVPNYKSAIAYDKEGKQIQKWAGGGDNGSHMGNFIKAVQSRKVEDLYADIVEGHLSSALCHTGNISLPPRREEKPERDQGSDEGPQRHGRIVGPHGRASRGRTTWTSRRRKSRWACR